jgi:hypothetical protein
MVSGGWIDGNSSNNGGGATCRGIMGAAAINCPAVFGKCVLSLAITANGVTINTNGNTIWAPGPIPVESTCQAQVDPENDTSGGGGSGGGPCAPPPSDQQFTNNGGGTSPDCEPLIIDVEGHGFELTNTANGVVFDIRADHHPLRIPWTANSNNAFLVLDRNGNGRIDDGTELFSNVSPQPKSAHQNGFLALAEYDKPENGGNGDGVIDERDAIFSQLRLWIDANHDGISQPEELHTLPELGVFSISLDYALSHRVDEFGNEFLYKARVNQGIRGESEVGRTVYDVFFVTN